MSLPLIPKYVGNPHNYGPRHPGDIPLELALQRGSYLFSKMGLWLRKDPSVQSIIQGFNPPADWSMPEETIDLIVSYFDSDERKEWLGREFWFLQGGLGILDEDSPVNMDDIPMFFNWLFRIPSTQMPANEPSPLTFNNDELQVQAGGRRKKVRKTRRRRSSRKTRKGRKT